MKDKLRYMICVIIMGTIIVSVVTYIIVWVLGLI